VPVHSSSRAQETRPLNQYVIGQFTLIVLSLISTYALFWKTTRDQRHGLELIKMQHDLDAADRKAKAAEDRTEREAAASAIREKLTVDAAAMQTQLHVTANAVRDRVELVAQRADVAKMELRDETRQQGAAQTAALVAQTTDLKAAIEAAKLFTAGKAEEAYHEANDVNNKLRKLHEAHAAQGEILQRLLTMLTTQEAVANGTSGTPA
jgi:hypothetical protein